MKYIFPQSTHTHTHTHTHFKLTKNNEKLRCVCLLTKEAIQTDRLEEGKYDEEIKGVEGKGSQRGGRTMRKKKENKGKQQREWNWKEG